MILMLIRIRKRRRKGSRGKVRKGSRGKVGFVPHRIWPPFGRINPLGASPPRARRRKPKKKKKIQSSPESRGSDCSDAEQSRAERRRPRMRISAARKIRGESASKRRAHRWCRGAAASREAATAAASRRRRRRGSRRRQRQTNRGRPTEEEEWGGEK